MSPTTTAACGVPEMLGALLLEVVPALDSPALLELLLEAEVPEEELNGPEPSAPQAASNRARSDPDTARHARRAAERNERMLVKALPSAQVEPMQKGKREEIRVRITATPRGRRNRQPRYLKVVQWDLRPEALRPSLAGGLPLLQRVRVKRARKKWRKMSLWPDKGLLFPNFLQEKYVSDGYDICHHVRDS